MYDEDQQIRRKAAALGTEAANDTLLIKKMSRFDSLSTHR